MAEQLYTPAEVEVLKRLAVIEALITNELPRLNNEITFVKIELTDMKRGLASLREQKATSTAENIDRDKQLAKLWRLSVAMCIALIAVALAAGVNAIEIIRGLLA